MPGSWCCDSRVAIHPIAIPVRVASCIVCQRRVPRLRDHHDAARGSDSGLAGHRTGSNLDSESNCTRGDGSAGTMDGPAFLMPEPDSRRRCGRLLHAASLGMVARCAGDLRPGFGECSQPGPRKLSSGTDRGSDRGALARLSREPQSQSRVHVMLIYFPGIPALM